MNEEKCNEQNENVETLKLKYFESVLGVEKGIFYVAFFPFPFFNAKGREVV